MKNINKLVNKNQTFEEQRKYYQSLIKRIEELEKSYEDVSIAADQIKKLKVECSNILSDNINFSEFKSDIPNKKCKNMHFLVRFDNELICINCGATTKDYNLCDDDLEFLTLCAEEQGFLLMEVIKEDIPLLKVLIEEQDTNKKLLESILFDDEYINDDFYLGDEQTICDLNIEINKAHKLDSRIFEGLPKVSNPKYLSNEKANELLLKISSEVEKINQSNSNFKNLLIEECKTAEYEVLILSGAHIPTLLAQTNNESEKIALTKAYYNLTNPYFRINSGYFNSDNRDWDAIGYDCRTANNEINQKILEIKLKR